MSRDFEERITVWLRDAVASGRSDFRNLVRTLPGVSPPEVAQHLARLPELLRCVTGLAPGRELNFGDFGSRVPHPLDFDWRFAPSAIEHLVEEIQARSDTGDTVLLLGCPTLAAASSLEQRSVWLVDRDGARRRTTGRCRVAEVDVLSGPLPSHDARVAVVDPPWYPEHQRGFLWAASKALRLGGFVLSSDAPEGSRPSALADHEHLVRDAKAFGLELVEVRRGALRYFTPPFEALAFRAARSPAYPVDWRAGDLAVFKKTSESSRERPLAKATDGRWDEFEISGVRIKVRSDAPRETVGNLVPVVDGGVLTNVSRRDPVRERVAVWTSGNRVFSAQNPELVAEVLRKMQDRPGGGCGGQDMDLLRTTLHRIVELERSEYIDHGGQPWSCKPGSKNSDATFEPHS